MEVLVTLNHIFLYSYLLHDVQVLSYPFGLTFTYMHSLLLKLPSNSYLYFMSGLPSIVYTTGCSLNIVFFLKMIFLNSASSAAALVFDLPLCTDIDTEGKLREVRVRNIF